jgi:dihydroorotase
VVIMWVGIPRNTGRTVRLVKDPWTVPDTYAFGDDVVRPLCAGEEIAWRIVEK